jgi:hypothetical protein
VKIAAAVVVALVAVAGFVLLLAGRDDAQLAAPATGPGELQPDEGAAHGTAADPAAELPTSGPHRIELVTRDRRPLSNDELLHALELGNVVLLYAGDDPPPALERIQEDLAGGFDPELAAAGQAVILAPDPAAGAGTALAWRRVATGDPAPLRAFTEAWLGAGAGAGAAAARATQPLA